MTPEKSGLLFHVSRRGCRFTAVYVRTVSKLLGFGRGDVWDSVSCTAFCTQHLPGSLPSRSASGRACGGGAMWPRSSPRRAWPLGGDPSIPCSPGRGERQRGRPSGRGPRTRPLGPRARFSMVTPGLRSMSSPVGPAPWTCSTIGSARRRFATSMCDPETGDLTDGSVLSRWVGRSRYAPPEEPWRLADGLSTSRRRSSSATCCFRPR